MESPGRVLSLQSIADHIGGSGVCDVTKEYIASAVERKEASEQVVLHYNSSDKLSYYLSADDINLLYADNNLIFRFHRIRTCLKFEAKEVLV